MANKSTQKKTKKSKNTARTSIEENRLLRDWFHRHRFDLNEVWTPTSPDVELQNHQLQNLKTWVLAWERYLDRRKMEEVGFTCPPVDPGEDLDATWKTFTDWFIEEPASWKYADRYGELEPVEELTDEEVDAKIDVIIANLEEHRITIDLVCDLPSRIAYMWIRHLLNETQLGRDVHDFHHPDTIRVIMGCDAFCPGCHIRPWCEMGYDLSWIEDEEAGRMVYPEEIEPYLDYEEGMEAFRVMERWRQKNESNFPSISQSEEFAIS